MKHSRVVLFPPLLALCAVVAPGTGLAQGFYVGVRAGTALGADTEALLESFNSPTRCDVLLYANPADAPTDPDCNRRDPFAGTYAFDPGAGTAGSVAIGYSFGGLSVEVEAAQRTQAVPAARFSLLPTTNGGTRPESCPNGVPHGRPAATSRSSAPASSSPTSTTRFRAWGDSRPTSGSAAGC